MMIPSLPPTPPPEGMHVLVVHLPIGLLLVAPLFVLLAAVFYRWAGLTALILLAIGTGGAFYAVYTGLQSRDVVEEGEDAMWGVLEEHEAQTIVARDFFAVLTVVYAVIVALPLLFRKAAQIKVMAPLNLIFLCVLMYGNLKLANAAHLGGTLVHRYGVHAALAPDPAATSEDSTESTESTEAESAEAGQMEAADSPESAEAAEAAEAAKPSAESSTDATAPPEAAESPEPLKTAESPSDAPPQDP